MLRPGQFSQHDGARLVIHVRGIEHDGKGFKAIARMKGRHHVGWGNTVFDILTGKSLAVSRALPKPTVFYFQKAGWHTGMCYHAAMLGSEVKMVGKRNG